MHTRILKSCAAIALGLLANAVLAADAPAPTSKWHMAFHGAATSDGQMQFRVTPHEGDAMTVTVDIRHGRTETFVARDVCDAFKAQLPKKRFKSEILAEKLLVKAGPGEGEFALELVQSSVEGARVQVTPN